LNGCAKWNIYIGIYLYECAKQNIWMCKIELNGNISLCTHYVHTNAVMNVCLTTSVA